MDGGTTVQIKNIQDFWEVAKEEEFFFWHFVTENQCESTLTIKPVSNITGDYCFSPLKEITNTFGIKVYESFAKDATEFLIDLGYQGDQIYNFTCNCFGPKFVGFKKGRMIAGTAVSNLCYCTEGIVEVIYLTNPSLFE